MGKAGFEIRIPRSRKAFKPMNSRMTDLANPHPEAEIGISPVVVGQPTLDAAQLTGSRMLTLDHFDVAAATQSEVVLSAVVRGGYPDLRPIPLPVL